MKKYGLVGAMIVIAGLIGTSPEVYAQAPDGCGDCHLFTGKCIDCGDPGGTGFCAKDCDDSSPWCSLTGGACGAYALAGPAGTAPVFVSWPGSLKVPQGGSTIALEVSALFGDRFAVDRKTASADLGQDRNQQEWALRRRCDGAVVYRHYGVSTARFLRQESSVLVL